LPFIIVLSKQSTLAKRHHPDNVGANDKEGASKFKEIAEAYQVLSDPSLRKLYDKKGMEGSDQKTNQNAKVNPALLFEFLFGSDKFKKYVGRLAAATSASLGDSTELSAANARILQLRRVKRLAVTLAIKLQCWVDAAGTKEAEIQCKARWMNDAKDLSAASYSVQLVHTIGKVGIQQSVQKTGCKDTLISHLDLLLWFGRSTCYQLYSFWGHSIPGSGYPQFPDGSSLTR
jgi:DnaJ-class molecular chaperone